MKKFKENKLNYLSPIRWLDLTYSIVRLNKIKRSGLTLRNKVCFINYKRFTGSFYIKF